MWDTQDQAEYIEKAVHSAAVTLQWQATDNTDNGNAYPVTENGDEYTDDVAALIETDVTAFVTDNYQVLIEAGVKAGQAGHDFILTANHHGAGFWDRGLGDAGDVLTRATRGYSFEAEFALDDGGVGWLMVGNDVIVDTTGRTELWLSLACGARTQTPMNRRSATLISNCAGIISLSGRGQA